LSSWKKFKTEVLQVIGFTGTRMIGRADRGATVASQVAAPTLSAFDENFIGPMTAADAAMMEKFNEDPMNIKLILGATHGGIMYFTPEEYEDDVNAFIYYMTMGMLDPTNIADVPFWKAKGWSTPAAFGLMTLRATLIGGLIGWVIDPMDKRAGGIAEYQWYQDIKKKVYDEPKEGLSKEWRERDDPDLDE